MHRENANLFQRRPVSNKVQIRVYYGSGTVDRIASGQPTDNAALCSQQMVALFCEKWRHGRSAVLKI